MEELSGWERYKKRQQLGRGSYGIVFLASDLADTEDDAGFVAIKCLSLGNASDEENQRAMSEVAILRGLEHEHILKYIDCFIDDRSMLCLVTEFVDGGDVQTLIKSADENERPLSAVVIADIARQLLEGLHYLHGSGVLHRDLKPANVYLTTNGTVRIGDFGVSKMLSASMSKAATFIGTPFYVCPELCMGEPYGFGADIWALGVLLYELFCGKLPFEAANMLALVNVITAGTYDMESLNKRARTGVNEGREDIEALTSLTVGNLIESMLVADPFARPSAATLLSRFFHCGEDSNVLSPLSSALSDTARSHHQYGLEETSAVLDVEQLCEAQVAELPWEKNAEEYTAMSLDSKSDFQVEIHVDPNNHQLVVLPIPHPKDETRPHLTGDAPVPHFKSEPIASSPMAFANLRQQYDPKDLETQIRERAAIHHKKRLEMQAKLRKEREKRTAEEAQRDRAPKALDASNLSVPGLPETTPSPLKRLVYDRPELLMSVRAILAAAEEADELDMLSYSKKTASQSVPVPVPPADLAQECEDDRIDVLVYLHPLSYALLPRHVSKTEQHLLGAFRVRNTTGAKKFFRKVQSKLLAAPLVTEDGSRLRPFVQEEDYVLHFVDNERDTVALECRSSWKYCLAQVKKSSTGVLETKVKIPKA